MKLAPDDIPLPQRDLDKALWFVQSTMRERLAQGELTSCPCCGGDAKVYARKFNSSMARVLRHLVASSDGLTARQIVALTLTQGDAGKLGAWGLARLDDETRLWHATDHGRQFAEGSATIPHRVLIFQGMVIGYDYSKMISIDDVEPDFKLERDVLSADAVMSAEVSQ